MAESPKISRRRFLKYGVATAAVVAVAGAGGAYYSGLFNPNRGVKEIVIGASIPLSGVLAYYGQEAQIAYQYAVDQVNANGGLQVQDLGKKLPVRLVTYDDATDPTQAVTNTNRLISQDNVNFLLGTIGTPSVIPASAVAQKNGIPYVTSGISQGNLGNYVFVVFNLSQLQYLPIFVWAQTLPASQRPTKVGIYKENSPIGDQIEQFVGQAIQQYGFVQALDEGYTTGQSDFSDLILKSKQANIDLVFSGPTPPDGINMVRTAYELGFNPQLWVLPRAADDFSFGKTLGSQADYVVTTTSWSPKVPFPGNTELIAQYQKVTGQPAGGILGDLYACAQILFDSIQRAGSLDRSKVRDAIAVANMMTTAGPITFRQGGDMDNTATTPDLVVEWQNGEQQIVWPLQYATAPFQYRQKSGT